MFSVLAAIFWTMRVTEMSAGVVEPEDRQGSTRFGELLLRHRLAAGLTQEELAERAGLGRRSIQSLERGENQPLRAQRWVRSLRSAQLPVRVWSTLNATTFRPSLIALLGVRRRSSSPASVY